MNKAIKIASITLITIALLIVGGFIFIYSSLDSVIKTAVESIASDMTQTRVELGDVQISPTTGEGRLQGFVMGNPDGYKANQALQFEEITVKVDMSTLTSDVVVINEVRILAPHITYELGPEESNIDTINRNTQSYSVNSSSDSSEGPGKEFIVEHLYLNDGEISVTAAPLGDKTIDLALPDIHLKDIGKNDKGASPEVILQAALGAVTKNITGAVGRIDLKGLAGDVAKGVTDGVSAVTDTVGSSVEGAATGTADTVKGAADSAGNALKGLLGN
ncbi:hypothetical protein O4H49_00465 [Kiloniella laminariae]|uniref:AsmA domain-containing protein n=1 Tax=Kiloniella laminariae TaxID=454162 RepID=A0ABT4LDQ3_9PROT|nr:hypothetical protein [Kiloniella laminariae]MCZ4279227.1 hypothetical protein [Kiloniella laminariae]